MLDLILITALVIIIGVPIFMNMVGPFIIWKFQKLPAVVKFQALEEEGFLSNRNEIFKQYDHSLIKLGFISIGSSMLKDSHTDSYFRLYWHADLKVSAMAVTMKSNVEQITYLEITQKYTDGTTLNVLNSPNQEAYPELGIKLTYRYPKIVNAVKLLEVHKTLRAKYKMNTQPVGYDIRKGFYELEKFIRKESDALVSKGIAKEEINADGKRSLTLYGAIVLTYRSIPPGKNIWGYITEKRAEAALPLGFR